MHLIIFQKNIYINYKSDNEDIEFQKKEYESDLQKSYINNNDITEIKKINENDIVKETNQKNINKNL